jgi:branched-chain amino acid transport system ATP-binding protein
MSGSAEAQLRLDGVGIRLGGIQALDAVDLAVPAGAVIGVIGPNGAGKTTLLNVVSGVYRPDTGRVLFDGVDITRLTPHKRARRGIGRTFQNVELIESASVLTNIALGRHVHIRSGVLACAFYLGPARRQEAVNRAAVEDVLGLLELGPVRDTPAGDLPAGQLKLVEVGRALAMQPRLLLLDEPSGGMSYDERAHVARQILRIRDTLGVTQVLIEHDLRFVRDLCDYLYVLDFGRVLAHGVPGEVLDDPLVAEVYGAGDSAKAAELTALAEQQAAGTDGAA